MLARRIPHGPAEHAPATNGRQAASAGIINNPTAVAGNRWYIRADGAVNFLALTQPVTDLPGLGPTRAKALERLDLHTVGDLLTHYPRRYEDRRQFEHFPNVPGDHRRLRLRDRGFHRFQAARRPSADVRGHAPGTRAATR